jgi:site-specific DNA-cytosine methylase
MQTIEDVLLINSYAGSLVLGAKAARVKIRGSYEDAAYGIKTQKLNFPELDFRDMRADWPKRQDLSRTVVLAHPPCAAFSAQNTSAKKGVDAAKFQCTTDVLKYAMENGVAAVAIESVQPALEGARAIHDEHAERYGYNLFRVLQNARDFGVPQNRARFWAVFLRGDLNGTMTFLHDPTWRGVRSILREDGEPAANHKHRLDHAITLMKKNGLQTRTINRALNGELGCGPLPRILKKHLNSKAAIHEISKQYCGRAFVSAAPFILDPDGLANTLLGDNLWLVNGRLCSHGEYKMIMGYPHDYQFSQDPMFLLSRGVCPPVATWILNNIIANVEHRRRTISNTTTEWKVLPGDTVDLKY